MITHSAILAALAELRTTAEAATPGPWHVFADESVGDVLAPNHEGAVVDRRADGQHIATWSPAAVLRWLPWAEQIAAEHTPIPYHEPAGQGWACSYEWRDGDGWRIDWTKCPHVRGLAAALVLEET